MAPGLFSSQGWVEGFHKMGSALKGICYVWTKLLNWMLICCAVLFYKPLFFRNWIDCLWSRRLGSSRSLYTITLSWTEKLCLPAKENCEFEDLWRTRWQTIVSFLVVATKMCSFYQSVIGEMRWWLVEEGKIQISVRGNYTVFVQNVIHLALPGGVGCLGAGNLE